MYINGKTDIGKVRQKNQDSWLSNVINNTTGWAIVCDGMGGVNGGEIASKIACETVANYINTGYRESMNSNSLRLMLTSAVYSANSAIYNKAEQTKELKGMGTTIVVAFVKDSVLYLASIGDSRGLRITKTLIERLTKDHSLPQALADLGELDQKLVDTHPSKNILYKVLGTDAKVDCDYFEYDLNNDDIIILCSDGFTNKLTDKFIFDTFKESNLSNDEILNKLVEQANINGGEDNITAVVISL